MVLLKKWRWIYPRHYSVMDIKVARNRVVDPDPHLFELVDSDPDPGGQKWPTNIEKSKEFSCFKVLDVLFLRAAGFSCSLCVFYGGLGITKLQFFIQKISNFFFSCNFFQFSIKTQDSELDPDPQLWKMLDPYLDPHKINADPQPWLEGPAIG